MKLFHLKRKNMSDFEEISGFCIKCGKKVRVSLENKSKEIFCKDCQDKSQPSHSDQLDSFDFDQGFNIEEVYDQ